MALRGKPRDGAKGGFSEGCALRVRIARPDASRGYGMITEERTNGRWANMEMLRSSASLSRGHAEPAPPRGGPSKARWPCGEDLETMRRVIFSEGRTLCVRLARLDVNRGRSWLGTSWREASGLAGACEAEANGFIAGVRSPPLRGVDHPI
jgi:hypothetical protein